MLYITYNIHISSCHKDIKRTLRIAEQTKYISYYSIAKEYQYALCLLKNAYCYSPWDRRYRDVVLFIVHIDKILSQNKVNMFQSLFLSRSIYHIAIETKSFHILNWFDHDLPYVYTRLIKQLTSITSLYMQ